jgi:hypothetical protein
MSEKFSRFLLSLLPVMALLVGLSGSATAQVPTHASEKEKRGQARIYFFRGETSAPGPFFIFRSEADLAGRFTGKGKWKTRLPELLATLATLGRARQLEDGRWLG